MTTAQLTNISGIQGPVLGVGEAPNSINVGDAERTLSVFAGAMLLAVGIVRTRFSGFALATLGGALAYRGLTGHCHSYAALGINSDRPDQGEEQEFEHEPSGYPTASNTSDDSPVLQSPGTQITADSKIKLGKADRTRINVDEDYEFQDWSDHFGVGREKIKQAVKAVGPMVNDVEK